MRLLPLLLFLVLAAAGLATGQPAKTAAGGDASGPCAEAATNASAAAATREWRRECAQNMTLFRRLSIESFNENKTYAIVQHEDNLSQIRASFMHGKLQAFEECRTQAAPYGRTEKGPPDGVFASCMKGKMGPLRDGATAAHQAERKSLVAAIEAAKVGAKARFAADRDAWLAVHPKP